MIYYLLCILGLFIQLTFIAVEHRGKYLGAVILKGSASVIFVILGMYCMQSSENQKFATLIVAGLILGALGDVILNLRFLLKQHEQKTFICGTLSFFTGHILYLSALIPQCKDIWIYIVSGAIASALLLFWLFGQVENIKSGLKIFGIIYLGTITMMTSIAFGWLISSSGSASAWVYVIGAVLFMLSDIVLIMNTFRSKKKFSMRVTNLTLYYFGQLLIAMSLRFI